MVKQEIPWEELRKLWLQGATYRQLGRQYGISEATVGRRARRENWRGESPGRKQLMKLAAQLRQRVEQQMQEETGTKELRELSAMLRELLALQREMEKQQPEAVRVLLEGETEEWSR